jgi:hypothetical protein
MHSYPHFSMPTVHPCQSDHSTGGGSDRYTAVRDYHHHQVRMAVGGRVIGPELSFREMSDRELAGDALPDAIDF